MKRQIILPEFHSDVITHLTTDWIYSEDTEMNSIIDDVSDSSLFKNVWFIDNPLGEKSNYVFFKRNYDTNNDGEVDSSDEDWIGPYEVYPNTLNNVYLNINSKVEAPIFDNVYIDDDNILHIEMKDIKPSIVKHLDTTYILERLDGTIFYKDLHNTSDLTSHTLSLSNYDIGEYEDIVIKVYFRNFNKVVSQVSIFNLDSKSDGVTIENKIEDIISELDFIAKIKNPNNLRYDFIISNDKEDVFVIKDTTAETIFIERYLLNPEEYYDFTIYTDGLITYNKKVKIKSFNSYNGLNKKLDLNLDIREYSINNDFDNSVSEALNEMSTIFYNNEDKKLYYLKSVLGDLFTIDAELELDEDLKTDFITFKHLTDDRILIECINTDDEIILYIVKTNLSHFSTKVLTKKKIADYSLDKISLSRSAYNPYNDSMYYLLNDSDVIKLIQYNCKTNELVEISELPNQDFENYFISLIDYNNILISATTKNSSDEYSGIIIYNIYENSYNSVGSFPEEFENTNLVSLDIIKDKILFLDTTGTNEDYLYFKKDILEFEIITKDQVYSYGNNFYMTAINEIFIKKHDSSEYNYFT